MTRRGLQLEARADDTSALGGSFAAACSLSVVERPKLLPLACCVLKHQVEGTVEVVSTDTVSSFARADAAVSVEHQMFDPCSHRVWCRLRMQAPFQRGLRVLNIPAFCTSALGLRDGPCGLQHALLRDQSFRLIGCGCQMWRHQGPKPKRP